MTNKFVIEVTEMSADYEDELLIGWSTESHKLLFFDSETDAEDVEVGFAESQDCDRKVEIKRIGWVEVPSCFRESDDQKESQTLHDPACECGACTGEDAAIEAMERGIVRCETNYEGENF